MARYTASGPSFTTIDRFVNRLDSLLAVFLREEQEEVQPGSALLTSKHATEPERRTHDSLPKLRKSEAGEDPLPERQLRERSTVAENELEADLSLWRQHQDVKEAKSLTSCHCFDTMELKLTPGLRIVQSSLRAGSSFAGLYGVSLRSSSFSVS